MNDLPGAENADNIFLRMRPIHRFIVGFLSSTAVYFFIRSADINTLLKAMLLWDVFCFVVLVCDWVVVFTCSPAQIRKIARKEDGSRIVIFIIVLVASLASMVTVLLLILSKEQLQPGLYLPVSVLGMLLSWILVHTTFSFHYARIFYGDDDERPDIHAGGLEFPSESAPDYLDFAYFSFVIGMTFQVSDVQISARRIRRQALVHGLLAFTLNTFVVALTVNLIAGLKG
ncbi:MAG: DUF1345 domain-containing protein [Chitinophagaceae bacterium]